MDNDVATLTAKVAALEERMNTKQAEYKTDIAMLDARMASRDWKILIAIITIVSIAVAILKYF